ncbi:MAG: oxalurate catabolism protein HpxZ [Tagaea sp.]
MRINDPQTVAEIEAALARYEKALVERDLATLDDCFWHDPSVVRFGTHENLYGIEEIRAFRKSVKPGGHAKASVRRTAIATFGADFACVSLEFDARRGGIGRQQQSWVRLPEGWKVVAAHVSYLPEEPKGS